MACGRFTLVLCLLVGYACGSALDTVTISSGPIMGVRDTTANIRYWRGVPFGASTGGTDRFKPPNPPTPWTAPLNCTVYGPGCISDHHNVDVAPVQSEDCLNLNIYVPLNASMNKNKPLPVMFFMYGGGFSEGDNIGPFQMYDGTYIASTYDVIVITINYRLGAFGYVVTDVLTGNYGLMDQRLAMKWVQQNIHVFNGDKTQVTIWGESAGAMSVGLHLVSPLSKGLFSKAIMESNPTGMLYKTNKRAKDYGLDFCKVLGCADSTGACVMDCLYAAPSKNITEAWKKSAGNTLIYIEANWGHIVDGFLDYMPTVDGVQVPDNVIPLLEAGKFATDVPVLFGTNTNEGATFVYAGVKFWLPEFLFDWAVDFVFGDNAGRIKDYYKQHYKFTDARAALGKLFTHYWFRCATEKFASAARNHSTKAFVYRYNHVLSASEIFKEFGLPTVCVTEVCHASELPLTFHRTNIPKLNVTLTPSEQRLSQILTTFWTNFAKNGDPNIGRALPADALKALGAAAGDASDAFTWPLWDETTRPNPVFTNDTLVTENSVELCSFWDSVGYHY